MMASKMKPVVGGPKRRQTETAAGTKGSGRQRKGRRRDKPTPDAPT